VTRRFLILIGLVCAMGAVTSVTADVAMAHGCTPGYYKNHTLPAPYDTMTVSQAFSLSGTFYGIYGNTTLKDALSLQGGPGLDGALQILFRTATASYLNSVILGSDWSGPNTDQIKTSVHDMTFFQSRPDILGYAALLDSLNNSSDGCPNPLPNDKKK
jgi:hypothetical protein